MKALSLFTVLLLAGFSVRADMTFVTATADTSLFEANPNNNLGETTLSAGTTANGNQSRALMRFDLSGVLPSGTAAVSSATLTLILTRRAQRADPVASIFDLFRLNVGWGEGDKQGTTGSAATAGEATWNERSFGSTLWTQPGGAAGSDYASQPSASLFMDQLGTYTFLSTPLLISDVQAWIDNPASNFGWIMISRDEAINATAARFGSSEEPPASAPRLDITYTVVPEPGTGLLVVCGLALWSIVRGPRRRGLSS